MEKSQNYPLPMSFILHFDIVIGVGGGVSIYIEGIYYNLFWHKSLTQWIQSPISACVLFWQSAIFGCMESIICFTVDNSLVMVDRRCLRTSLFKAAKPDEIELMSMFTKALSWFMLFLDKQHLAIGKITYFQTDIFFYLHHHADYTKIKSSLLFFNLWLLCDF